MNLANAKRTLTLALAGVLLLALVPVTAFAEKPYFKAYGGDVFAGGWFRDGINCAIGDTYQDDRYVPPADPVSNLNGGIHAYAKTDGSGALSEGGSSVEFAAFALGLIDGPSPAEEGFYSSSALAPTVNKTRLSFANMPPSAGWGGLFQGSTRQSHCIPDYFGTKQDSPDPIPGNLGSLDDGQYLASSPDVYRLVADGSPQTIDHDKKVTVFIDGNTYIGSNIEYQNGYREDNVPKLAIVVKGNLYIGPGVSRLDGVYVAQPRDNNPAAVDAQQGVIWTCHPDNNNPVPDDYPNNNCRSRLLVNGALIAKQINLMRIQGDIGGASNGESALCGAAVKSPLPPVPKRFAINIACNNVAEVINYGPEMIMGGPFFNSPTNRTTRVQSLISLPPVF